jgi:uncharacterized protein (DUF1778 family)
MSVLSLRLPASIHEQLRTAAEQEGISINQFVTLAIAEKMANDQHEDLFAAARNAGEPCETIGSVGQSTRH